MNNLLLRPFSETLILACKLRAPHLIKGDSELHQGNAAKFFGIPQPTFYRWLRDGALPTPDKVTILAKKLRLTPAQIRGESPLPDDQNSIKEPSAQYFVEEQPHKLVPIISSVQAGKWREAVDNFHPGDADQWQETTAKVSSKSFALRVTGKSMQNPNGSPSIPHGSIVIVDPEIVATNSKIVVAKLPDTDEAVIKKLVIDGSNSYL
jgi:SOS-response transcriptional repressor LexA